MNDVKFVNENILVCPAIGFVSRSSSAWEPKYVAYPGGMALPRIFTNLRFLISKGPRGVASNAKIS